MRATPTGLEFAQGFPSDGQSFFLGQVVPLIEAEQGLGLIAESQDGETAIRFGCLDHGLGLGHGLGPEPVPLHACADVDQQDSAPAGIGILVGANEFLEEWSGKSEGQQSQKSAAGQQEENVLEPALSA